MTNYPNMSYCMCENTAGALEQIIGAMMEEGPEKFYRNLSRQERRWFNELAHLSKDFHEMAEETECFDTV